MFEHGQSGSKNPQMQDAGVFPRMRPREVVPLSSSGNVPLAVLLVLVAASAGCVAQLPLGGVAAADATPTTGPAGALPADWYLRAMPSELTDPEHDHADWAQHAGLSTPNFRVLGYDALSSAALGSTPTGMGCGGTGTTSEGRRIAVVHSISTDVAFLVADVTDPAHPVYLGEYLLPNVVVWDATVTADGKHALVGAYPFIFGDGLKLPPGASFPVQPQFRDWCTGETRDAGPEQYFIMGPALVMVGLQDPTAPTLEQWIPQPVIGPHSVTSDTIDGVTFATSSVTNLMHDASYYSFFQVVDTPAGGVLQPLSVIQAPGMRGLDGNGHIDVELAKHPVTGQLLAYLANWNDGVAIFDLSIPQAPVQIGHWADADAGSLHETLPMNELWDGKHYTLAGQEVGEPVDLPSGWVYVLDTTDPANPVEVGRWTLPVKPKWDGGLQFSTHYVEVVNRTMFVANYHGGLWAVDLSNVAQPLAIGLFVPDRASPTPHENCPCEPSIEDVVAFEDGTLTVWDAAGGVYALSFDASDPAPAAPAWPVEAAP